MNQKIEAKKKLLKEALSKNHPKNQSLIDQRIAGKILQRKTNTQKPIQSPKTLPVTDKPKIQEFIPKQRPMRIEEEISSINQDNSMYTHSENFSQKPSYRSSFSESLYTQETDNVKTLISKVFDKKGFVDDIQNVLDGQVNLKSKQQVIDIKQKLLNNQARIRQRKGRERQELVERQVKKKVTTQILLNQNQKECYNAEIRIQDFLQDKLRRIKRKEF